MCLNVYVLKHRKTFKGFFNECLQNGPMTLKTEFLEGLKQLFGLQLLYSHSTKTVKNDFIEHRGGGCVCVRVRVCARVCVYK